MISGRERTAADSGERRATVCKTVYRRFESRPWDHLVESKSAFSGADSSLFGRFDSNRDSNVGEQRRTTAYGLSGPGSYGGVAATRGSRRGRPVIGNKNANGRES